MDFTAYLGRLAARFGLEFARPEHLAWLRMVLALWVMGAFALRRGRPLRLLAALLARTAAFVLCILLLAGLSRRTEEVRPPSVIAAVDVSDSMGPEGREWAEGRARELFALAAAAATKGVVLFARGSEMAQGLSRDVSAGAFSPDILTDATDISAAIKSACLAFPPSGPRRLLIFSDGNENSGDAVAAAVEAGRDGVRIDCLAPPPRPRETRLSLVRLDLPEEVSVSERFVVRIIAENRGEAAAHGSLELRAGEKLVKEWPVPLQPGTNAFELPYAIAEPGTHRITATLTPLVEGGAGVPETVGAPVLVVDRPRILCVGGTSEGRNFLAEVLEAKDIETQVGGAEIIPDTLEGFLPYDCIVLSGVPRRALGEARMKLLKRYVEEHGGGLVMLGGPDSFGPGGYGGTPVEELLPVSMGAGVPYEREKTVRLCIILVIDKSGSMAEGFGGKIVAARRSAEELVKQLQPNDMVGIIPFDAFHTVLVPLGPVGGNAPFIIDRIRRIYPGGDTRVSKPMEEALRQMRASACKAKHVVVLTDGMTRDVKEYDYRALIAEYARNGVTVSTVGIGRGADSEFLRAVALGTGGDYYHVKDASTLPMIVLQDARRVLEKTGFLEERIVPRFGEKTAILKGIRQEELPVLEGYVITAAKRSADVALYTDARKLKDPLLASWRRGLGKTVAWTSDAEGRWSGGMVGSRIFGKFWAQIIRWAMRERSQDSYLVRLRSDGGRDVLELRSFSPVKEGVSFRIAAGAAAAKGRKTAALHQVAPDVWAGEARGIPPSLDSVTVERVEAGKVTGRKEVALFRRGPAKPAATAESVTGTNLRLLEAIARAGGGGVDTALDAASFAPERAHVREGLAPYLLPLVFALLLLDIAARKLWM